MKTGILYRREHWFYASKEGWSITDYTVEGDLMQFKLNSPLNADVAKAIRDDMQQSSIYLWELKIDEKFIPLYRSFKALPGNVGFRTCPTHKLKSEKDDILIFEQLHYDELSLPGINAALTNVEEFGEKV